jgi:Super-infection exclusion protein B
MVRAMDSFKDWTPVLEWIKRPSVAFAMTIILGTLLLWNELRDWLGFDGFRLTIAILCAIALVAFLSHMCEFWGKIITAAWAAFGQWIQRRRYLANYRKRLHQLTSDEKFILKKYIDRKTRTQNLDRFDGVVISLENAGIIYRGSDIIPVHGMTITFPYIINEVAWDYLNKHPGILAGLQGQIGWEEKQDK